MAASDVQDRRHWPVPDEYPEGVPEKSVDHGTIQSVVAETGALIQALGEALDDLELHLTPVLNRDLGNTVPSEFVRGGQDTPSPLSEQIAEQNERLRNYVDAYRRLISRIDL